MYNVQNQSCTLSSISLSFIHSSIHPSIHLHFLSFFHSNSFNRKGIWDFKKGRKQEKKMGEWEWEWERNWEKRVCIKNHFVYGLNVGCAVCMDHVTQKYGDFALLNPETHSFYSTNCPISRFLFCHFPIFPSST